MKKLALVLGGGAAKGYCHIGVLKVLEEHGIVPDLIVGTSMGALVGGLYANGYSSKELEAKSMELRRRDFMDIDIFALFKQNIMSGRRLEKLLLKLFGDSKHSDTRMPFVAVSTSLDDGKQYNLNKGPLARNVNASIAIPALFKPVLIDGKSMVDGGAVDNVPDDVAREILPDAVILSIDAIGDYYPEPYQVKVIKNLINMIMLMQVDNVSKQNFSDLRIKVNQHDIKQSDFGKKAALYSISKGEEAMRKEINNLKKLLKD